MKYLSGIGYRNKAHKLLMEPESLQFDLGVLLYLFYSFYRMKSIWSRSLMTRLNWTSPFIRKSEADGDFCTIITAESMSKESILIFLESRSKRRDRAHKNNPKTLLSSSQKYFPVELQHHVTP